MDASELSGLIFWMGNVDKKNAQIKLIENVEKKLNWVWMCLVMFSGEEIQNSWTGSFEKDVDVSCNFYFFRQNCPHFKHPPLWYWRQISNAKSMSSAEDHNKSEATQQSVKNAIFLYFKNHEMYYRQRTLISEYEYWVKEIPIYHQIIWQMSFP